MTASALNPLSAPAERAPRRTPRDAARCIVGEYLRDWGLRDPDAIAAQSREIVDQAMMMIGEKPAESVSLAETALGIAVDRIAAAVVVKPETATAGGLIPQACVVAEVSHILDEFPHLATDGAAGAMANASSPIVPQLKRSEMPAQPGTRLLRLLSPAYYQSIVRRMVLAFDEPAQGTETIA